jgi:hypothetical protein
LCCIISSNVSIFGINPRRGGRPLIDIRRIEIGIVVEGLEFCQDVRDFRELVKFSLIIRIIEVVMRR